MFHMNDNQFFMLVICIVVVCYIIGNTIVESIRAKYSGKEVEEEEAE